MKNYKITVLRGDGIGPEIVNECIKVLDKAGEKFGFSFDYNDQLLGGCAIDATVVEWLTAKLLERVNRRRWWDYSGKRFNVDGYICLQYSLLWGALGTATVLWGNGLLFKLYGLLPQWLVRP